MVSTSGGNSEICLSLIWVQCNMMARIAFDVLLSYRIGRTRRQRTFTNVISVWMRRRILPFTVHGKWVAGMLRRHFPFRGRR
jgi:hypothetical protein